MELVRASDGFLAVNRVASEKSQMNFAFVPKAVVHNCGQQSLNLVPSNQKCDGRHWD